MGMKKKPLRVRIGLNVRRIRLAKGLSQEALADLAGIDRTYLGSVERGERNISADNIERLIEALGIDLAELGCNEVAHKNR